MPRSRYEALSPFIFLNMSAGSKTLQLGNVLLHCWMELVMSFESFSLMVWRLELVGLHQELVGAGRVVEVE